MPAPNQTGIRYRVARRTKLAPDDRRTVPEHSGNAENLGGLQGFCEARRRKNSGEALVLMAVARSVLDRRLAAQAAAFETAGGFNEPLYRVRSEKRSLRPLSTRSTKYTPSTSD